MKKILLIVATLGLFGLSLYLILPSQRLAPAVSVYTLLEETSPLPVPDATYAGLNAGVAETFARVLNALLRFTDQNVVLAILLLAVLVTVILIYPTIRLQLKQKKIHLFHRHLIENYDHGKISQREVHGKLARLYTANEKLHAYGAFLFTLQAMVFLIIFFALVLISNAPHLIEASWGTTQAYLLAKPATFAIPLTVSLLYFLHSLIKISFKEHEDYISPTQSLIAILFAILSATVVYFFSAEFAVLLSAYFMALVSLSTVRYLVVEHYAPRVMHKIHASLLHLLNKPIEEVTHWKKISLWFNHLPIVRHINLHLLEEGISMSLGLMLAINFFGVFNTGAGSPLTAWVPEAQAALARTDVQPCNPQSPQGYLFGFTADTTKISLFTLSGALETTDTWTAWKGTTSTLDFPERLCLDVGNSNGNYQFLKLPVARCLTTPSYTCDYSIRGSRVFATLPSAPYYVAQPFQIAIGGASATQNGTSDSSAKYKYTVTNGTIASTSGTITQPNGSTPGTITGTANITFTPTATGSASFHLEDFYNSTNSVNASFTITDPVLASIAVAPQNYSMGIGATRQFTATAKNGSGGDLTLQPTFTWFSSASGVASVDRTTGRVTGVSAGTAGITASTPDTRPGVAAGSTMSSVADLITITIPILDSISVTPTSASIQAGNTTSLVATSLGHDGNGNTNLPTQPTLTWTSSDTTIATVNDTGLVRGVAAGTATITATSGGITSSTVTITVTAVPVPITYTPPIFVVSVPISITPAGGTPPYTTTYTSNPANGSVTNNVFTATARGTGTLRICDSATTQACITVPVTIQAPVVFTSPNPLPTTVRLGDTFNFTFTGDFPNNTTNYIITATGGTLNTSNTNYTANRGGDGSIQVCYRANPANCSSLSFTVQNTRVDTAGMRTCPTPTPGQAAQFVYEEIFANGQPDAGKYYVSPIQGTALETKLKIIGSGITFPGSVCVNIPETNNSYQLLKSPPPSTCLALESTTPSYSWCTYSFRGISDVTLTTSGASLTDLRVGQQVDLAAAGGSGEYLFTTTPPYNSTTNLSLEDTNDNSINRFNATGIGEKKLKVCDKNNLSNCSAEITFQVKGCAENFRAQTIQGDITLAKNTPANSAFRVYPGEAYRLNVQNSFTPNTFDSRFIIRQNPNITLHTRTPGQNYIEFEVRSSATESTDASDTTLLISDPVLPDALTAHRNSTIDSNDCWIEVPIKFTGSPIRKTSPATINIGSN